jgi:hypothetical protein
MPKFWENLKNFSLNAQSLRLWKSSLTQNWIHSNIIEKLIISFRKCNYATSCSYILRHRTVSIPVTKDNIICAQAQLDSTWLFPIMGFLTQLLYTLKRISPCFSPATHAGVVQQNLHRRLRVKTVGTPRSFPLHYSHRGFGVTHWLNSFFNFHFPHILTLGHR